MSIMIPLSVPNEFADSIETIKKRFSEQGYERMFSPFAVNAIISSFETRDWGEFLSNDNTVFTTADIVHDSLQDNLTGDERWIKVLRIVN